MTSPDVWRTALPSRAGWVRPPALGLAGFLVALALIMRVFLYSGTGQRIDQLALLGAKSYEDHSSSGLLAGVYDTIAWLTSFVVALVGTGFVILVVVVIVGITVWRRTWMQGLGALLLFAGANLTTQAMKAWAPRPDYGLYETYGNSLPSGHTTVAAATVFAILLLTPAWGRWAVALVGGGFVAAMAWGTLVNSWHRPSDTVAAICVSAVWYALVETIRRSVTPVPLEGRVRNPVATRTMDVLAGISAALGVGILAALILTLPDAPVGEIDTAVKRLGFVGAFFGIGAAAITTSRLLLAIGPREETPRTIAG